MKRKLIVIYGAGFLTFFCAVVWMVGGALSTPAKQAVGSLPEDLHGREVKFSSSSDAIIKGWLIPGRKGRGAVILMHGVRGNRLDMLGRARFLNEAGYSILLFDFQAHGESTGEGITFGYLESKDAQAAVNFLHTNLPEEKLGLIGVSMGGAATLLATPPLEVNAMVLEMVYPTIEQAITARLTIRLGKWASILTPLLSVQFKPRLGVAAKALRPINQVTEIKIPKLFVAGSEDRHTTLNESRQLFDAAGERKEFWVVNGAAHTDLHQFSREEYEERILSFFAKNLNLR